MSDGDARRTGIMYGAKLPTLWLDYVSGQGVTDDGARATPIIGRGRKTPNLTDMLDMAHSYGAKRIMLTGRVPSLRNEVRAWLLVQTPGWKQRSQGHRIKNPPVGRFQHAQTGHSVDVRLVSEWFEVDLTPAQAREAWQVTETAVQSINERQHLLYSPSRTGLSLWWATLPKTKDQQRKIIVPPHVSQDIADDLHRTSNQQHVEHLVAGPNFDPHPDSVPLIDPAKTPRISTFTNIDGRFMYAATGRELGIGPGVRLNAEQTALRLFDDVHKFDRIWCEVRFIVPEDWHHIGILGVRHENVEDGWFFPNRPGARHVTWADASEVQVAIAHGWKVEALQGILFQKDRPMDNFMAAINRVRTAMETNEELAVPLRRAVVGALRALLIQTVGALASRGGTKTMVADSLADVPPMLAGDAVQHGKVWVYEAPGDKREIANYHPEISVQIWGRARARLLQAPTARDFPEWGGVLTLPGSSIIGVQGDAVYTTEVPAWSLPTKYGGGDDGTTGRLRIKGTISGNLTTPASVQDRDRLKARTEKAGPSAAWTKGE